MLARYRIVRGKRDPNDPLPDGTRLDVRAHRNHVLSPDPKQVEALLEEPSAARFAEFAHAYRELLARRFESARAAFDALAEAAREGDVYIGCNCPTHKQPDLKRCHTMLALAFMKAKYPQLKVRVPR